MPTREELRRVLKERCKTMDDYKALVKPVYPYHQDNTSWKTEQEKVDNNIEDILDRSDRDRNINVRLLRRLGLPTTEEEQLISDRRKRTTQETKRSVALSDTDSILEKLNKDHRKILTWFYDGEFLAGKDYDPEFAKAAPCIGYDPADMKVHCQDLCSYGLMKEQPPPVPGKYSECYRYHLTDEGRTIAAILRNRQPWRKIIKAPWEWAKASASTIIIFLICQWAWDAWQSEPEKQEPPQQQTTQPATEQQP